MSNKRRMKKLKRKQRIARKPPTSTDASKSNCDDDEFLDDNDDDDDDDDDDFYDELLNDEDDWDEVYDSITPCDCQYCSYYVFQIGPNSCAMGGRDHYGKVPAVSITLPNLRHASYVGGAKDAIALEFDQPVLWAEALAGQFYLDGEKDRVATGGVSGNVLTLKLKVASSAQKITYLKEVAWNQDILLNGANGLAALTFCEVPILSSEPAR